MKKDVLQKLFEITGNEKDALVYLKNFRSISPESFALITIDSITFSEYGESFLYDLKLLQKLELFPIVLMEADLWEYAKHFFLIPLNEQTFSFQEISTPLEVTTSIQQKKIPILIYNQYLQFQFLQEIISQLKISKLVYLFSDLNFNSISLIHLKNDYENLCKNGKLSKKELEFLSSAYELLSTNSSYLRSISITTPACLLKELFTIKGSGTLIKLGTKIEIIDGIEKVDKLKLLQLLETAFQKKVKTEFFDSKIDFIILEINYRGAAILKRHELGYILSKSAVDEISRGEGIGREIWDKMRANFSKIFWRANPRNPINKWYIKESDGFFKFTNWYVYWIGLSPKEIPEICKFIIEMPVDFYE